MKVSVVIPTYRRPGLLVRCIQALLQQDFEKDEYEIIVVSDGPDMETSAEIAQWTGGANPSIIYMATAVKKGPAASRNLGWRNSSAHLVAFTDDDCIPERDWLRTIWNSYKGEEFIVFTGKVTVPRPPVPTDYELNISNLETAEFVTANCVCTKRALEVTGGFDERFGMAWREDSDLHFKLLQKGISIRKIQAVVVHPVRKAPWGVSIKEQKKGIYNALLYKKYPGLYRERIKPSPSWNYYGMVVFAVAMVFSYLGGYPFAGNLFMACWLILLMLFVRKRLSGTTRSRSHVMEMVVTSAVIPFVSIFWQWYGSFKFRVMFL